MQPKIQRVEDATARRYSEIRFEVRGVIPHQRCDAIASLQAGAL
jgi:hypothetical protein